MATSARHTKDKIPLYRTSRDRDDQECQTPWSLCACRFRCRFFSRDSSLLILASMATAMCKAPESYPLAPYNGLSSQRMYCPPAKRATDIYSVHLNGYVHDGRTDQGTAIQSKPFPSNPSSCPGTISRRPTTANTQIRPRTRPQSRSRS